MLTVFCLRLACGMLTCLLLLSPRVLLPNFFRTHFLTALGLTCVATVFSWTTAAWVLVGVLVAANMLTFLGSAVWSLEGAPGGRVMTALSTATLAAALTVLNAETGPTGFSWPVLAGDLTSAAVLGTAITAMLIGHSYLIAPGMSLTPLFRLLSALGVAVMLRMGVEGYQLLNWTQGHSFGNLSSDVLLWLPVRWGVGLLGPLVLGGMAWQTARLRSTQSATGILYVVVIVCFLGELTGQLLRDALFPLER